MKKKVPLRLGRETIRNLSLLASANGGDYYTHPISLTVSPACCDASDSCDTKRR